MKRKLGRQKKKVTVRENECKRKENAAIVKWW